MTSIPPLPQTHRALILASTEQPPTVEDVPCPQPTTGAAIVRVIAAGVVSYMRDIYNGTRQHPFPTPLVIGSNAIGRVVAVGADAIALKPGQLVFINTYLSGRDDPAAHGIMGILEGPSEKEKHLMNHWRDGSFAEYIKMPLENCLVLDEKRLLGDVSSGGLGYTVDDLMYLAPLTISYAGLREMDVKSGETVAIAPATGEIGGAAVLAALAMGANVVAMGRNVQSMQRLAEISNRVRTVPITGDVIADLLAIQNGTVVDAFLDLSPPTATDSTHIKSCLLALRPSGRASFMGGIMGDVAIPYGLVMYRNLTLKGRCMYDRQTMKGIFNMVESGILELGAKAGIEIIGPFKLEDWKTAFDIAAERSRFKRITIIKP